MTGESKPAVHQGRNIKRFREMLGIKQEVLAVKLGEDWTQKKVSILEQKDTIEADILEQVARILGVPVESIKNFDEQAAVNIISNTFNSHDTSTLNAINYQPSFNPMDKIVQLYDEKIALLERLLQAEKEKNELLKSHKG